MIQFVKKSLNILIKKVVNVFLRYQYNILIEKKQPKLLLFFLFISPLFFEKTLIPLGIYCFFYLYILISLTLTLKYGESFGVSYTQILKRNSDQAIFEKYFGNLGSSFEEAMKDPEIMKKSLWSNGVVKLLMCITGFLILEHICAYSNFKYFYEYSLDTYMNPDQPRTPFKVPETTSPSILDKLLGVAEEKKDLIRETVEKYKKSNW